MAEDTDGLRLTRRTVLAGLAGAVGIGGVGGAGTRALLRDEEVVPGAALGNPYKGNRVDLKLDCPEAGDACRSNAEGVTFAFEKIDPPATGRTTVCLELAGEPAWVWLRTTPPVDRSLADGLVTTLAFGDGTPVIDPAGETVEDRPLNDVLTAFEGGGLLRGRQTDGVFSPPVERCLELSWSLPDRDTSHSEQSVGFELQFAAVQYRVGADASATNPWRKNDE